MIVWNEKVKKSEDVMKAIINELMKEHINVDGVVENFNNGVEQGSVLKIYDRFNFSTDLCIWVYLSTDRKVNNHIDVIIGKHINCNDMNMWEGEVDFYFFEDSVYKELHKKVRNFLKDFIITRFNRSYNI